ncbi:hypothetical protein BIW11_05684 [Tropilaelaps mercedesae]|uniref:Centrosomal protein of 95 kDa-like n=1 Tax=Tropilaelaps mercedesae TaxID=418985 RepID=A0A1V9Y1E1_9ACAR|nr:hypothetical protein BIW11_05684 [Tropilaelaps mercedesae]
MTAISAGNWSALCTDNENVDELLNDLCVRLKVSKPYTGFSPQLVGELFTALTSIQIPKNLTPLELISHVTRILSEEVVRAPLDHLDATELSQGQPEAVQDLLEIFTACVHLRDIESSTTTSALSRNSMSVGGGITAITSGNPNGSTTSFESNLSSSSASSSSSSGFGGAEQRKDSPLGSSVNCNCESMSSELSSFSSSLSEPTQDIQLPCQLCQYLARFSFEQPTASDLLHTNNGNSASPIIIAHDDQTAEPIKPSSSAVLPKPIFNRHSTFTNSSRVQASAVRASVGAVRLNGITRPSKLLRMNSRDISKQEPKTTGEQRRELREMANVAKHKFDEEKKLTPLKLQKRSTKSFKNDVIISQPSTLRPVPMPAPESAIRFGTCDTKPASVNKDEAVDECAWAEVSPHMARVLKKQYSQHLQWMASHGTSEDGLKKLEKEYEDLLERHTARSNQVRKEICEQARVTALSTQKGVAASIRNLRTYARTQEQQLAHNQLEIERIARSKETRRRMAEERLLRETFTEGMRLQKKQLLSLNRELAEKRGLERDRHQIYIQGMEHFYRTQLDMLQETLERQARDGRIRTGAQMTLLRDMRKELRAKLDDEMKALREAAIIDFDRAFDSSI